MKMECREYRVTFLTPAFLGDAEQKGRWRTPPFKALLRQWWRVVKANELLRGGCDPQCLHTEVREAEGRLFGHAWLKHADPRGKEETWAMRSRVRLRLEPWELGQLGREQWPGPGGKLRDVVTTADGKGRVRSDVYLGYGPVLAPSKKEGRPKPTLGHPPAIAPDESARLTVVFPSGDEGEAVEKALMLIHWIGNLGGRANNGWGAIHLSPEGKTGEFPTLDGAVLSRMARPLSDCLGVEWPHAIGHDETGPLVWRSRKAQPAWHRVVDELAELKVSVRRKAKEFTGPQGIGGVHLLGYPAGDKWKLSRFENDARWGCQLHFSVAREEDGLRALVYHLPHRMPATLTSNLDGGQARWLEQNQEPVWGKIHGLLDAQLTRLAGAGR
jgi:CRISPR-associated protein Cmr1